MNFDFSLLKIAQTKITKKCTFFGSELTAFETKSCTGTCCVVVVAAVFIYMSNILKHSSLYTFQITPF